MSGAVALTVDPEVQAIVRPHAVVVEGVRVAARDDALGEAIQRSEAMMRESVRDDGVVEAVRTMYKRVGLDPTRTRPSSEALLRRVRRGEELPSINNLVDVINWCSLESGLPFGLYDLDRIAGRVTLRLGRPGEQYAGIRKDLVHVAGRLALVDDDGPFGNPSSDSARTMVTAHTTRALVVIFAPASLPEPQVSPVAALTEARLGRHCR